MDDPTGRQSPPSGRVFEKRDALFSNASPDIPPIAPSLARSFAERRAATDRRARSLHALPLAPREQQGPTCAEREFGRVSMVRASQDGQVEGVTSSLERPVPARLVRSVPESGGTGSRLLVEGGPQMAGA